MSEYLAYENEAVRLTTSLYLLNLPATQANLKSQETMEIKSRYLEVERKLRGVAEQAGMEEVKGE